MKYLALLSLLSLFHFPVLFAQFQWEHTNGPNGGSQWSIWYSDNYAFYSDEFFLYRTSNGLSWEKIPENAIWPMATHGSDLVGQFYEGNSFAYTQPVKLKVSHDDGGTWAEGTLPPEVSYTTKLALCNHGIYLTSVHQRRLFSARKTTALFGTRWFRLCCTPMKCGLSKSGFMWGGRKKFGERMPMATTGSWYPPLLAQGNIF
ncbi:MAG: hypothetical protein ACKVUS_10725 [Saprospiraceae bacterium]